VLQKRALRTMLFMKKTDSCKDIFKNLGILPFPCIFIYECAMFLKNHEAKFREHETDHSHNTRNRTVNVPPKYSRLEKYRNGPFMSCIRVYNKLLLEIKCITSISLFAVELKKLLLESCFYSLQEYFDS
jgi:hypothetical protein